MVQDKGRYLGPSPHSLPTFEKHIITVQYFQDSGNKHETLKTNVISVIFRDTISRHDQTVTQL